MQETLLACDSGAVGALELKAGVFDGMRMLAKTDLALLLIVKHKSEHIKTGIKAIVEERGGRFDGLYVCSTAARGSVADALFKAREELYLEMERSFLLGDKAADIKTGKRVSCRTVLVGSGSLGSSGDLQADYKAEDFLDAAAWVHNRIESSKIKGREELRALVVELKRAGKTIVTCNGSFDIFHTGHLKFLQEAKAQGDVLIIGLNSDTSIKRYKSKDRPIINQAGRAEMMAGFECVDYVTVFDETDPRELLKIIGPHVHVNGAEYGRDCIEAPLLREIGARLHLIKSYGGLSTSQIIEKIKRLVE